MRPNLVAPVILCKRGRRESLSILTLALLELLVVCWALARGEPIFVVVGNCVLFLLFLVGWLFLSQMCIEISFKNQLIVICVRAICFKRIHYLDCRDGVVACLAGDSKKFYRRARISFVSGGGDVLFKVPFSVPYDKGGMWCIAINGYIADLKGSSESSMAEVFKS